MKFMALGCALGILLLPACQRGGADKVADATNPPEQAETEAALLTALVDEFFEQYLELNPLLASSIGDSRYNHRLANDIGPEHMQASAKLNREFLARVLEIDADQLQGSDRMTYDTFRLSREMYLEGLQFPSHLQPLNQFNSFANRFVQLGSGGSLHPFKTVRDYDDFLGRIDDFVVLVNQAIENMRAGMREGIVQPAILMRKVLPQLESQLVDDVEDSAFFTPLKNFPENIPAADRERLTATYRTAIAEKLIPAYRRLYNFVGDDYMSAARDTVGLSELPGGASWYAYLVRLNTTTDLSPDEIHQIGLHEVARIHDQMREVMDEVGFTGDLKAFFDYLNTDDSFYFDEAEQLIQGYRDMAEHIAGLAPKLFSVIPKTPFEVRRVEPFRERSAPGGQYSSGTPDGSRPGVFYANAYDIKARPKWAMESLFLHEAIPGHHFQRSIQRETGDMPQFRRYGGYTAYTEGWGLYAESLGKELGVYTDPYQYFGALNAELWRAIRLVVDTGLHAKGWSRQDVLDYMYDNSPVKAARAVSEAERFMAIPGQALAYKMGQLKIRELRTRAEIRLAGRFDVREFHRVVLEDGPLPLNLLDAKIERWIDAQI